MKTSSPIHVGFRVQLSARWTQIMPQFSLIFFAIHKDISIFSMHDIFPFRQFYYACRYVSIVCCIFSICTQLLRRACITGCQTNGIAITFHSEDNGALVIVERVQAFDPVLDSPHDVLLFANMKVMLFFYQSSLTFSVHKAL